MTGPRNQQESQNSAAGAERGEIVINVAPNSVSSSVLPMLDRHKIASSGAEGHGAD